MKHRKQRTLAEITLDIEELSEEFRIALHRNDPPTTPLDFQQRIVRAAQQSQEGTPLKDLLDESELFDALQMLADILVTTGVRMPTDDR